MATRRLTTAQALLEFLAVQHVERDGVSRRFFAGCFGIFGHGNVAGVGQALQQVGDHLRYYQSRNEQAMVHAAAGYARMSNRLGAFVCTSSIGPGATNMVTGAAGATINRLPVLLLPGDLFAARRPRPVLQQLEDFRQPGVSVNDAFRPVSVYWDRIERPEQLVYSAVEALRVLTDPAETGAVTLALPQDVQAEAYDFPDEFFAERVWHVPRPLPDQAAMARAVALLRTSRRPLIVAGGGVIYSEATAALRAFVEATGIPVVETMAGKGSMPYDHSAALGAAGVTGTPAAVSAAREADVVLGIGTRWSDFTTASQTIFAHPQVRFVNVNVSAPDAHKFAGEALVGDARATLDAMREALDGYRVGESYASWVAESNRAWDAEVQRIYDLGHGPLPSQGEVIGAVNAAARRTAEAGGPEPVVVCAAGSMPGDLHKLWRTGEAKGFHVEYGYSCMGYEIPGGLGVKMADPSRDVYVLIGDGSYLMMATEIVTAVQEGCKLLIVLVQNHGYASIGALSASVGSAGFGTRYRYRTDDGTLEGDTLPVDLAANAESLGARVLRATSIAELHDALAEAGRSSTTTVVHIETDPEEAVPSADAWWDVPVAEVSLAEPVQQARDTYEKGKREIRHHLRQAT